MGILITGGNGFVGRNLVELFSAENYPVFHPNHGELDLADARAVERFFKEHNVETIVHCATVSRNGTSYPPDTCEKNLRMFFNLRKYKSPAAKLINLGSGSEYSRAHWRKKMPEEYFGNYIPEDGHSFAKYIISNNIQNEADDNVLCLRIFGMYGKHENYRYKFISNAIVKNILNMPIVINQNVVYDYMYITDFFRIVKHFVEKPFRHRIVNVTTTESIDLLTIARLINDVSVYKSEIRVLHEGVGVEYSGDNSKLLSELGDFQFMSPSEAIADLYQYYLAGKDYLDAEAIKKDAYLGYAQKLRSEYFKK